MPNEPFDPQMQNLGDEIRAMRAAARAARGILSEPPLSRLQLVTADNATQFTPVPKKRGRPRKVVARGNVMLLSAARSTRQRPAPRKYDDDLQRAIEAYVRYAAEEWERTGVVPLPQLI